MNGLPSARDANPEDVRRGKLVLVDLAGSESLKKVGACQGFFFLGGSP